MEINFVGVRVRVSWNNYCGFYLMMKSDIKRFAVIAVQMLKKRGCWFLRLEGFLHDQRRASP